MRHIFNKQSKYDGLIIFMPNFASLHPLIKYRVENKQIFRLGQIEELVWDESIYFKYKIRILSMTEPLIMSRMRKDVSPAKLHNLSPDKYGKAAWADLSYTPAKLADNVIYRQVTTLKKHEEGTNRLRQFQAMNDFMKERLMQLEQERDGIQVSLSQQINMYKKMYHESEAKHEARLKQIQKRFCSQISTLITQKQEQAKYSQAEKQMLEERIAQLQQKLRDAEDREEELNNCYGGLRGEKQKLDLQHQNLKDKICQLEKDRANEQNEWKKYKEDQKKKSKQVEKNLQEQLQNLSIQKVKEKDAMQRLMKTQLDKLQNIRTNQNFVKTQQMREIRTTFDNQTKRLNEIISMKDRMIEGIKYENAKIKENLLQVTANYETQVNSLAHKGNDLNHQVDKYSKVIAQLEQLLEKQVTMRGEERDHLGRTILELKDQLHKTEVAFIREKDKYEYWGSDLQKENIILKTENKRISQVFEQNQKLTSQIQNLRSLLMESSYQIERSKQQLMKISYERDTYSVKMEKVLGENERLYRMKRQIEEDAAVQWRNSYYQRQPYR